MSTEKRYIHKKICVCRSCKGTGKIVVYEIDLHAVRRNGKSGHTRGNHHQRGTLQSRPRWITPSSSPGAWRSRSTTAW